MELYIFTDAHDVWFDLKEQFHKINGSIIIALHRDVGRLSQDNSIFLNTIANQAAVR